jgi:DNA repair protein RadD
MLDQQIIEKLSRLGVGVLSRLLGEEKTATLNALGLSINTNVLSQALLLEHGRNILKEKMIRLALFQTIDRDKIEAAFSVNIRDDRDLEKLASFGWGDNNKSRIFLAVLGIDDDQFFDELSLTASLGVGGLVSASHPLHSYQDWVRRQIVVRLQDSKTKRSIVHMPTGSGKTRVSMEAIADYFRLMGDPSGCAVWMAHSEELCEQACEAFEEVWVRMGPSDANIVRLWGGQTGDLLEGQNNFVVTSFQTAHGMIGATTDARFSLFTRIKQRCNLLIVDEAHRSVAPTYKNAIELISNNGTKILGLTATPGRTARNQIGSGNEELAQFYGNSKITIVGDDGEPLENPLKYLQEKRVLSTYEVNFIEGSEQLELSDREAADVSNLLDIPQSVLNKLGADHVRTARVAAAILEVAINRNLQTIVFAPTKDNAIELALYLRFNECAAAAITGETPSRDRARYIEEFRDEKIKVLTNFGVLTTGFDAPGTEAVIIARPTLSVVLYSQMVGRGLRGPRMGGTEGCLIIDVKDNILNLPDIDEAFSYFDDFYGR